MASPRAAKYYEKLAFFTLFPAARPLNIFFLSKKKIDGVFIRNRTPIHEGRYQNQKFVGNETPYCLYWISIFQHSFEKSKGLIIGNIIYTRQLKQLSGRNLATTKN